VLRQTECRDGTIARCCRHAEDGARDSGGDRLGDGTGRGGEDYGGSRGRQFCLAAL
jgi:hypothetical protein